MHSAYHPLKYSEFDPYVLSEVRWSMQSFKNAMETTSPNWKALSVLHDVWENRRLITGSMALGSNCMCWSMKERYSSIEMSLYELCREDCEDQDKNGRKYLYVHSETKARPGQS